MIWIKLWPAAVVLVAGAAFALWLRNDRAHQRELGETTARLAATLKSRDAYKDSLVNSRAELAKKDTKVKDALDKYDSLRASPVVVRRVLLPGETDTVTVVHTEYIIASDSLRQECGELRDSCLRFRQFADSTIAVQDRLIADLGRVSALKKKSSRFGVGGFAGECVYPEPKLCAGVGLTFKLF